MKVGIKRNCCPLCGGVIVVSALQQYSLDYRVLKSGRVSKRYTVRDCGSMEVSIAGCLNEECDAYWDADSFAVDVDGSFFDYKYEA